MTKRNGIVNGLSLINDSAKTSVFDFLLVAWGRPVGEAFWPMRVMRRGSVHTVLRCNDVGSRGRGAGISQRAYRYTAVFRRHGRNERRDCGRLGCSFAKHRNGYP